MEITSFNPDRKLRRPVLTLKDYLLDDLISCSSNGFKSFPRRPSTVRFLIDVDLKGMPGDVPLPPRRSSSFSSSSSFRQAHHRERSSLKRSPSKGAVSALRRASMKVINAVKLLTFPSAAKSASVGQSKPQCIRLPRSLSRKLLSSRFWRRSGPEEPEMGQWRVFRNILAEKDLAPDSPPAVNAASAGRVSTSSSSGRNCGSSSWDSSEFGEVDTVSTSSGNSVSPDGVPAVVSTKKDLLLPPKLVDHPQVKDEEKVSGRVGGIYVEEEESPESTPTAASSKEWPNEEKEQLSPVSVLDCPFKDDEEASSTLEYSPIHVGGARKKHGRKSLSQLEPLNLDQRLALSELSDGPIESTPQSSASPSSTEYIEENEIIVKAEELLQAIKINNPLTGFEEDNLLSDFFIEKLELGLLKELEALELAEDWLNGTPRELWTGWEVQTGRTAYLRDMEKCGSWTNLKEEQQEVATELEVEVWSSLMEEIFLDL